MWKKKPESPFGHPGFFAKWFLFREDMKCLTAGVRSSSLVSSIESAKIGLPYVELKLYFQTVSVDIHACGTGNRQPLFSRETNGFPVP